MTATAPSTLARTIADAKAKFGIALMPFIAAGYPDLATSMKLLPAIAKAGAALCEVGFPFSDPIADGPVIQQAFKEALDKGLKVRDIFAGLKGTGHPLPSVAMISYSMVYRFGVAQFVKEAKAAGMTGLLLPDLPPPEAESICKTVQDGGLETVLLVSPSTPPKRREEIAKLSSGFIYYLSLAGVTGERTELPADLGDNVKALKSLTDVPVCVGFGINKPQHVKQLQGVADGAIVGSAYVRRIKEAVDPVAVCETYTRELLSLLK